MDRNSEGQKTQSAEIPVISFVNILLDYMRPLVLVPLGLAVLAGVLTLVLRDVRYVADSRFMPQSSSGRSAPSGLAGLAAQFGISVGDGGGSGSLEYFAALVNSREILAGVAATPFTVTVEEEGGIREITGTPVELLEVEADSEAERFQKTVERLQREIRGVAAQETGLVRVEVSAPWPSLAVEMNRRILILVNQQNLEMKQEQAAAEREFIESRLAAAQAEMDQATRRMENFLERNRRYDSSPELQFQHMRLERDLELRQQVYLSLAQAYEQVRVDQVRNTPVIAVVEPPEGFVKRQLPSVKLNAAVAFLVGLLSVLIYAFSREHFRRDMAEYPEEYGRFQALTAGRAGALDRIPLVGSVIRRRSANGAKGSIRKSAGVRPEAEPAE